MIIARIAAIALILLTAAGCQQVGQDYQKFASSYERSYSVSYSDADGRNIGGSVTLKPVEGLKK